MANEHYTKDHEWVRVEGNAATCGISDFAQKALGDVVYVELPAVGRVVKQGEQVAVVESVKAASEVFAPIDGKISAVNEALSDNPALVNTAPIDGGWFFKLESVDGAKAQTLMDAQAYADFVKAA
jgi:glycine cleavage system H protein